MHAGALFELVLDAAQVAAAIRGEEATRVLAILTVAETRAPHARDLGVPRQRHERLRLRDADQLPGLRAIADVVAVPVREQVRRRPINELEALAGDALP